MGRESLRGGLVGPLAVSGIWRAAVPTLPENAALGSAHLVLPLFLVGRGRFGGPTFSWVRALEVPLALTPFAYFSP